MGPLLRKELGEQFVAAGLVGAAMELFEELELWDALIMCYRLLQKNVQAEELVRKRLEVGLACLLCKDRLIVEYAISNVFWSTPCSVAACCMCQPGDSLSVQGQGPLQTASPHMHAFCALQSCL